MTNITELPDSFERQWRVYEGQLRAFYSPHGVAPNEFEYAAGRLKPIYLEAARMSFTSSATHEVMVRELNTWVNRQVFSMMAHLVARDIQLYRLRGDDEGGPGC